jgi:hypothetical protein
LVGNGYNVRIPTCKGLNRLKEKEDNGNIIAEVNDQSESIQLTTGQTSATRLVTKVNIKKQYSHN